MRKLFIILFWLIACSIFAVTRYVSTTGLDSNPGTFAQPYLTIQYGVNQSRAGDTLFYRSGVYYLTSRLNYETYSGTAGNEICFMGYPADVAAGNKIIIDCDGIFQNSGISIEDVDYLKFKDFTIRNAKQDGRTTKTHGIFTTRGQYIYFENIISHGHGGYGFGSGVYTAPHGNRIFYTNCDSYNNYDSDSPDPGNGADGFCQEGNELNIDTLAWSYITVLKCRSWGNSDDGFSNAYGTYATYDSCFSWGNGYLGTPGVGGDGFRMGLASYDFAPANQYVIRNNVSVYNQHNGFYINQYSRPGSIDIKWYNNTTVGNLEYGFYGPWGTGTDGNQIVRNNIAYLNVYGAAAFDGDLPNDIINYNTWTLGITLNATDFVSLDTTGISAARQVDGSFPNNNFYNLTYKLSNTSQAINKGIDVDIDYILPSPDLGAFEFNDYIPDPTIPLISTKYPSLLTLTSIATGGYMIDDGGEAITAKGICYSTTGTPTTASNTVSGGSGTADFNITLTDLTASETYYIRAYAINSQGTGYGATYAVNTSEWSWILNGTKFIKHGTKLVIVR